MMKFKCLEFQVKLASFERKRDKDEEWKLSQKKKKNKEMKLIVLKRLENDRMIIKNNWIVIKK